MNKLSVAAAMLPIRLNSELLILTEREKEETEEIRLRAGRAMTVLTGGRERVIAPEHILTPDELEDVLTCATGASMHSVGAELSRGYISAAGGIRVGVCGTAVMCGDSVNGIRGISSLSLRIPHEHRGIASDELSCMLKNGLTDILIISPPGGGKTSCLREFIRVISDAGHRVAVADERGELAAVLDGEPQLNVGAYTDVLSSAPKAKAAMLLLRAMNPEMIAMDEISSAEDVEAVHEITGCGVKLMATAHAADTADLYKRRIYRELIESDIFRYCLVIENVNGKRSYSVREMGR